MRVKFFKPVLAICFVLLLATASLMSACGQTTNANSDTTDVVDIPYTGNETISSDYEKKDFDRNGADLSSLYSETVSSVVSVKVKYTDRGIWQTQNKEATNTGTGFFLTSNGYILTSSSLFVSSSGTFITDAEITVKTSDGSTYSAQWIYSDVTVHGFSNYLDNSDLTLIKVSESGKTFDTVTIGNSEAVQYGEDCYTIATFSDEQQNATSEDESDKTDDLEFLLADGIVSRPISARESNFIVSYSENFFDGSFEYLIQTTLPTNDGSEGAPVFNKNGEVVGILNLDVRDTSVYEENPSFGISFSVPSKTLQNFLNEAETAGYLQSGEVSVTYSDDSFTEQRNESLLYDGASLTVLSADDTTDQIEIALINEGEFVVAESQQTVVLRSQSESAKQKDSVAETVATQKLNATVQVMSAGSSGRSEGSGFIVSNDGYIVTNLHVINKNTSANEQAGKNANETVDISGVLNYVIFDNIKIDGKYVLFRVSVVAYDQTEDIAVLKLENPFSYKDGSENVTGFENICTLETSTVKQGQTVIAIGNALGYGLSVSEGIVSVPQMSGYYSEYGHNFIQTDCPINSGNSGGPLYNSEGNVVGINSMGLSDAYSAYENVSWAIPSENLKAFLDEVNSGSIEDGVLIMSDVDIQYKTTGDSVS